MNIYQSIRGFGRFISLEREIPERQQFFFIKYLRTLGFDVANDIFAENAWYFRNALVRANYNDLKNGVHETTEYLELFLRNLLLDEKNELHNRAMHISGAFQVDEKADIEGQKADIEGQKADIREKIEVCLPAISEKTVRHILLMHRKYGNDNIFGRSDVEELTELKSTRASELLKMLLNAGIIRAEKGHGKGKYRFLSL